MKKYILAAALVLASASAMADINNCAEAYDIKRGDKCSSTSSLSMRIKNVCSQKIDMQYCLKNEYGGGWDCGVKNSVGPGESTSYYVCKSDSQGNYRLMAREAGSSVKFNNP